MVFHQTLPWILGSSSPRRHQLFANLGLKFTIESPETDETIDADENPSDYVKRMSGEKADAIEKKYPEFEGLLITADTIVVFENEILGKPKNPEQGFEFLKRLNGNVHQVITSVTIKNSHVGEESEFSEETQVRFASLPEDLIRAYSYSEDPADKAGGYSLQGPGTFLVESIQGSFNNVIGFPIEQFVSFLLQKRWLNYR